MKVFLLAAGKGSRISKNIPEIPKCTLDICGQPLILRTIRMLKSNGIHDITIVVGYKHEIIQKLLKDLDVNIVYNPFYDVTNSIASLWMAQQYFSLDEETLIANADVFWTQELLDQIFTRPEKIFLLSDVTHVADGDYFFNTDSDGKITDYGKELPPEGRTCEYVGIAYLHQNFIGPFIERMNLLIDCGEHGVWWENILYSYIKEVPVYALDVAGKFWAEVDYIEDYNRILGYTQKLKAEKEIGSCPKSQ